MTIRTPVNLPFHPPTEKTCSLFCLCRLSRHKTSFLSRPLCQLSQTAKWALIKTHETFIIIPLGLTLKATFLILNAKHKYSLVQGLGVFSYSMAKHSLLLSVKIHHGSTDSKAIFSLYFYWYAILFAYFHTPNLSKDISHSYGNINMKSV